jgi:hypothetical protein
VEHVAWGTPLGRTGSEGPRWRTLAWELFLGYAFALAFLAVVVFAVVGLGIAGREGATGYRPEGVREFPFVANGPWSLAANLFWVAAAGSVCALAVWVCLRARIPGPVSIAGVAVAVVAAGYVPTADAPGLGTATWPVQFVVALLLVRGLAVGRSFPVRVPVRLTVAATVAAALWGLVAAAYGVSHPISLAPAASDADDGGDARWSAEPPVFVYPPVAGRRVEHSFALQNRGFADVRVQRIRLPAGAPFRLEGVKLSSGLGPPWPGDPTLRSSEFTLPARSQRWLALDLRTVGCVPRADGWLVRRVLVDYELFGRSWTQPVPLIPAPALECVP